MTTRDWEEYCAELRRRKAEACSMGGPDAVAKVHARGKLAARERVALLLDPESFQEIGLLAEGVVQTPGNPPQRLPADGVVTGWGTINGRPVCVVADDGTLLGGAAVPTITILLRKAHGAAMWAMGGRGSATSPDVQIAWPLTLMTGAGPTSAVYTVHSKELQEADDPEQLQRELEARYSSQGSVYEAAAVGGVDDIIEPPETRRYLIRALAFLRQKQARALGPKRRLFP